MSFQKMDFNRTRPGGRNAVLLYGFSALEVEILTKAYLESGIDEWLYLDESRAGQKIKVLLANVTDNQGIVFTKQKDQVILFNGTSQYELQQFVSKARALLKGRPLIAMVTPTSKNWVFNDLVKELKQERFELERNKK